MGERWDGDYKDNFTKETWKKTVKSIQTIIDEAAPKHTYYTIEPMPWMYPISPDAVSYTHLDVYKRQNHKSVIKAQILIIFTKKHLLLLCIIM